MLPLDLDLANASKVVAGAPVPPNYVIQNPRNGHAQAGWLLLNPARGDHRAVDFAESVHRNIRSALRGDRHHALRGLVQNPLAPLRGRRVEILSDRLYPLRELAAAYPRLAPRQWRNDGYVTPNVVYPGARNCAVFDWLRHQPGTGEAELLALASDFNSRICSPPLSGREVRAIARSVSRYRTRHGSAADNLRAALLRGVALIVNVVGSFPTGVSVTEIARAGGWHDLRRARTPEARRMLGEVEREFLNVKLM